MDDEDVEGEKSPQGSATPGIKLKDGSYVPPIIPKEWKEYYISPRK